MRADLLTAVLLVAALSCGAFSAEPSWSVRETPILAPAARNDDNNVERRTHGDVTCKLPTSCAFYSDVLLVVKLNPVRLLWLDVLQRFYGRGMPNMVFFSSLRKGERHDGDGKYLGVGSTTQRFISSRITMGSATTSPSSARWRCGRASIEGTCSSLTM
jgi:hypothetical protein